LHYAVSKCLEACVVDNILFVRFVRSVSESSNTSVWAAASSIWNDSFLDF
jgi:hypothetical protein